MKLFVENILPEGLTLEYVDNLIRVQDLGPLAISIFSSPQVYWKFELFNKIVRAYLNYQMWVTTLCNRYLDEALFEFREKKG